MTNCGEEISNKNMSKTQILELGISLLQILECLHSCGYVHNDLKMENILSLDDKFYLIDFSACSKFVENGEHILRQSRYNFHGNLHFSTLT